MPIGELCSNSIRSDYILMLFSAYSWSRRSKYLRQVCSCRWSTRLRSLHYEHPRNNGSCSNYCKNAHPNTSNRFVWRGTCEKSSLSKVTNTYDAKKKASLIHNDRSLYSKPPARFTRGIANIMVGPGASVGDHSNLPYCSVVELLFVVARRGCEPLSSPGSILPPFKRLRFLLR